MTWFHRYQLIERAANFAREAHESIDQRRKYSGEPYFMHCEAVTDILLEYSSPPIEVVAASLLHDVVEDTPVTIGEIYGEFGIRVAQYVSEVTNPSKKTDGNRAKRKAIDLLHLSHASYWGASIKYADIIHNISDIVQQDPDFARVFLKEKMSLLTAMYQGNRTLRSVAWDTLRKGWKEIYGNELVIPEVYLNVENVDTSTVN